MSKRTSRLARRGISAMYLVLAALQALTGRSFGRRVAKAAAALAGLPGSVDPGGEDMGLAAEIRKFTAPGPEFEEFDPTILGDAPPRAKLIAYYLPQFHRIEENDTWWGRGFTEWTSLARGAPRFAGHYQPRIPRDFGHYSLDNPDAIRQQAEYAVKSGIHGFCFYHYWFNGRTVLQKPLELFLANRDIRISFCAMWANHDWTRMWHGEGNVKLLSHDYDTLDDADLVDHFSRMFTDDRYIEIGGRPLLFVYSPATIPDAPARIETWRRLFFDRHNRRPLLFMAQMGSLDPREYGLDGAIEFPPHKFDRTGLLKYDALSIFDRRFDGKVASYDKLVEQFASEPQPPFPLIKTVCPGWDNDPRYPGRGFVFHGSTPGKYEDWLCRCIDRAREAPVFGEPFVAVNAWNEWAEGAYLEPDIHYGAAYLNATARALRGAPGKGNA